MKICTITDLPQPGVWWLWTHENNGQFLEITNAYSCVCNFTTLVQCDTLTFAVLSKINVYQFDTYAERDAEQTRRRAELR
jgi:hypothetical protein